MVTSHKRDLPAYYSGRILIGNYSPDLLRELNKQISSCFAYEQIDLPIFPYIAAWRTDKKGIWYEYVSKQFLDLFQTDADRITETFCNAVIDRREYDAQQNYFPDIKEQTLKREEIDRKRDVLREKGIKSGIVEAVYKVRVSGGRELWLKDWASVTSWPDDSICLSPGYLTDVTKEMSVKDQIDEMNLVVNRDKHLLVEAERHAALGRISAQVFHEIRNPIVSISGLSKRLLEKGLFSDPRMYLEVIAKEAKRLEDILGNLFQYTREVKLRPEPLDPVRLIKHLIDLVRSDIDQFNIKLTLKTDPELPQVRADRRQIQTALLQIINNSIEALDEGGELSITIAEKDDYLIFSILDSGIGFRPSHRKKLAEPFFSTKVYGTGLGLSLAQKAIKLHNGHLVIDRLDSGSTLVTVTLPIE